MKRIPAPVPNYLTEMVVDYVSLIDSSNTRVTLFSHSPNREKMFGITHYNLIYDKKNKLTKIKTSWEESLISILYILMSKV